VYRDFLLANNRALRDVGAQCRDCHYIEVGPFEPDHFLDTMHFSPRGLDEMARRVADGIGEIVKSVVETRNLGAGQPSH
jgi:lysophospholipase L1-like esterase